MYVIFSDLSILINSIPMGFLQYFLFQLWSVQNYDPDLFMLLI